MGDHADDCINAGLDELDIDDADWEDYGENFTQPRRRTVTCKRCGVTGLSWVKMAGHYVLYANGKPHVCDVFTGTRCMSFEKVIRFDETLGVPYQEIDNGEVHSMREDVQSDDGDD